MMRNKILCLACLFMLSSTALAAGSYSVKSLMMEALNSPTGRASGIIEGKEADKIHETTGSFDPLRGEVTTLKRYKEEGCSRLALKLTQPNTPTKEGKKVDFIFNYELNLCKNGKPPRDMT